MSKEYEFVSHEKMRHITAFLVQLERRIPHLHRDMEIGYVVDGILTLKTEARCIDIKKGDIYLLNRMESHEFSSSGSGATLLAIQIGPSLMDGFLSPDAHLHYEGCSNVHEDLASNPLAYELICATCIELAYSFLLMEDQYEFHCFTLCAALIQLLHDKLPWSKMSKDDYEALKARAARMLKITNFIDQNFQRKLLLGEIAENEGLTVAYLSHLFKDAMGKSFQEYLNQKRFEHACGLLFSTNMSILDISLSSGFSDARYFNRAFSKAYGCQPKEYRKGISPRRIKATESLQNTQSFLTEGDALKLMEPLHMKASQSMKNYSLSSLMSE